MTKSVKLDDKLIEKARKLGKHKNSNTAVTAALKEYIRYKQRIGILDDLRDIDYDPDYDYKAARFRDGP